jgi:DNA-binding SARP family transcriptional activator
MDVQSDPAAPALLILGPLRLQGADGEVALGGDKPRRLLAALALHAGEWISADRLIDLIWAESAPRSARQNLQTYVWSLRRSLRRAGAGGIDLQAQANGYLLAAGPDALDWHMFRLLVKAGGRRVKSDPAAAAERLRAAVDLWRGPALADLADGLPQLAARITGLEEARLSAVEQRVEADLAAGRHCDVVAELAEFVCVHPFRERFRAQQMLALYRCGRQAEALIAYQSLRRELADSLGIDPSLELASLQAAILRRDAALDLLLGNGGSTRRPGATPGR